MTQPHIKYYKLLNNCHIYFSIGVLFIYRWDAHILFVYDYSTILCGAFRHLRSYQQSFDYSKNIFKIFHLLLSFFGEARELESSLESSSLSSTCRSCVLSCCCCFSEPFLSCQSIGITRRGEEL